MVSRTSGVTVTVGLDRHTVQLETLSLSIIGKDVSVLKNFVQASIDTRKSKHTGDVNVFIHAEEWGSKFEKVSRVAMSHSNYLHFFHSCRLSARSRVP